jgi:transposase-like protein
MKTDTMTGTVRRRRTRVISAKEKSQAVLSLWSGRRNTSALTQALGVSWGVIHDWERRALSGMLTALDPGWQKPAEASALPPRVEKLITQTLTPAVCPPDAN